MVPNGEGGLPQEVFLGGATHVTMNVCDWQLHREGDLEELEEGPEELKGPVEALMKEFVEEPPGEQGSTLAEKDCELDGEEVEKREDEKGEEEEGQCTTVMASPTANPLP